MFNIFVNDILDGLDRFGVSVPGLDTRVAGLLFADDLVVLAPSRRRLVRMLGALEPALDEVASRCGSLGADDLAQPAPLLDLLHGTHDRLHSRLFQS